MLFVILLIVFLALVSISPGNKLPKDIREELQRIDTMNGVVFEHYAASILRKNGFNSVNVTQSSGDFGADIIAIYKGSRYVIQCKNYSKKVGILAVQEIYAAKQHYHADSAAVLTNSYYTNSAIRLANDTSVILWDRNSLIKLISNTVVQEEKEKNSIGLRGGSLIIVLFLVLAVFPMIETDDKDSIEESTGKESITIEAGIQEDRLVAKNSIEENISRKTTTTETNRQEDSSTAYVGIMRKNANVRAADDAESEKVGTALAGEKIVILTPYFNPKWHQVLFEGKTCYISANYCIIQEFD